MTLSVLLIFVILVIALVPTMVGLGGGLIFSPLFVILGLATADAASASLFLNLIAAASAAYNYSRKKRVGFTLAIPLIISASLAAPVGSYFNSQPAFGGMPPWAGSIGASFCRRRWPPLPSGRPGQES